MLELQPLTTPSLHLNPGPKEKTYSKKENQVKVIN